jgi:hypothetical protein
MPFKNPEDKTTWQRNYYHTHNLKKVQTDRRRLNYWRKKFIKTFNCLLSECKKFTEQELKDQIESGMCKI